MTCVCGETDESKFYKNRGRLCKLCISIKNKEKYTDPQFKIRRRQIVAKWASRPENAQKLSARQFKAATLRTYNLTVEAYATILNQQGSACKICGVKEKIHIDHDHACCKFEKSCGKCIRGLICKNCNYLLANARDNVEILKKAVEYLENWNRIK